LASPSGIDDQIEAWLSRVHAPMGLDLGADSPTTIALSVISEIQQCLAGTSALPLRKVRAHSASLTTPG
jgi:xanthine/CO dehydrogenase XdhC/CoxF family maturation factor